MDRITIETSLSPNINIQKVEGNLRIKGWDRTELKADSTKQDTLNVIEENGDITITCKSGIILRVPLDSSIHIGEVQGELMLKSLENEIEINTIHGQLLGKSVGNISIETVNGNMNLKYVEGNAVCKYCAGNLSIQDVEGSILISNCTGNLSIRGNSSSLDAKTNGNAFLRLDPKMDGAFKVQAGGNIQCRLEPDLSAEITLVSKAGKIRVDAFGISETITSNEHQLTAGNGNNEILLDASGNIDLTNAEKKSVKAGFTFEFDEDLSTLAEDITQVVNEQIEIQMDAITKQIDELTLNIPTGKSGEKTKRKLEAKRISLERKMDRLDNRQARASAKNRYRKDTPADPISTEERQKVLEMLQNQLISVEEAEVLLAALEGKTANSQNE